ncbi:MAG: hypothetical protein ACYDCL_12705 [Myxococcales bacterium]
MAETEDVPLQKASIIERCLRRVAELYGNDPAVLQRVVETSHQDLSAFCRALGLKIS